MKRLTLLLLANLFVCCLYAQNIVYDYQGDFNEEGTSFGLRITHSTSATGHTHLGDYLINLSSRGGGELYHLRLNSDYNTPYNFHLERISGQIISDDNILVMNSTTEFNMEIRFHGPQNDWHRITVHEITPPRGNSPPTFLKINPSEFANSGTKIEIGATSTSLEVNGNALISGDISTDKTSYTKFQLARHDWSGSHGLLFNSYFNHSVNGSIGTTGNTFYANDTGAYSGGAGAIIFYGNGGTMDFVISPQSTGADTAIDWGGPKMRIKRNGYVGIGIDPTEKLTVDGKIRSEEVKVEIVNGPDYVFEENYDLRTLEETETYIKANKHLPEIPSAKEMEATGVELGEMNMLLLKKIEELTLYTIGQQKLLNVQTEYLSQQQRLIEAQQKQFQLLQKQVNELKQQTKN